MSYQGMTLNTVRDMPFTFLLLLLLLIANTEGWGASSAPGLRRSRRVGDAFLPWRLSSQPPPGLEQDTLTDPSDAADYVDEDAPAGIGGAEFFGGAVEKQELFDPVAEAAAGGDLDSGGTLDRFAATGTTATVAAFDTEATATLAKSLQEELRNPSLLESALYAANLVWETPFSVASKQLLRELQTARGFYRELHVAVTGGKAISASEYELYWEMSLVWPTFWEPRIVLTGSSRITVTDNKITKQTDTLDEPDLFASLVSQWLPRFWDIYHVGMTPSAELSPRFPQKTSFVSGYQVHTLPPRWYLQASMLDIWDRSDAVAATIPNHSFSTIIKTMGPTKQNYTTCSPVQVTIMPRQKLVSWLIPIAVSTLAANSELPLPGQDPESDPDSDPQATYVFVGQRRVATVGYGGQPQDAQVAAVRKQLYERILKDGLRPKLDTDGRPIFFFWQESVKACYTNDGLGMIVYEWRPEFALPARIGIELEL